MDYTTKLILGVSALGALLLVWAVWKFFTSLLKHVLIALALAAVGAGGYWSRMRSQPNPAIGKHAYLRDNGRYLGVVEGAGDDAQRGEVWAIRPPGGYPKMYGRGRVVLGRQGVDRLAQLLDLGVGALLQGFQFLAQARDGEFDMAVLGELSGVAQQIDQRLLRRAFNGLVAEFARRVPGNLPRDENHVADGHCGRVRSDGRLSAGGKNGCHAF